MQHAALHCNTVQYTIALGNTLHHTAAHCNTLQHTAAHFNTLHHTAPHCTTLPHSATHCNTLHHPKHITKHSNTLQSGTLQRTAPHCNTQHALPSTFPAHEPNTNSRCRLRAAHTCSSFSLLLPHHTHMNTNTQIYTQFSSQAYAAATHCNTLQHTVYAHMHAHTQIYTHISSWAYMHVHMRT